MQIGLGLEHRRGRAVERVQVVFVEGVALFERQLAQSAIDEFGKLDILVSNAGVSRADLPPLE